jgi:hypothetical protein
MESLYVIIETIALFSMMSDLSKMASDSPRPESIVASRSQSLSILSQELHQENNLIPESGFERLRRHVHDTSVNAGLR